MINRFLFVFLLLIHGDLFAQAQCPPGFISVAAPNPSGNHCIQEQTITPPFIPPSPVVIDSWGAIAGDKVSKVGFSDNYRTEKKAKKKAIKDCKARGGGDCKIIVTFANQCVAIIAHSEGSLIGFMNTEELAEKNGMIECKNSNKVGCRIYHSFCSNTVNVK